MYRKLRTHIPSLLPAALALIILAVPASAQSMDDTRTNFRGNHTISGFLFWPDGSPVNRRIRVRLSSMSASDAIGSTNEDGKFTFTGIGRGSYTVTVDEDKDHGSASGSVSVTATSNAMPQTFTVTLRLSQPKRDPRATVVDADNASVPKKAMASYQKALEAAKTGDHSGAISLLQEALSQYQDFVAALTELGVQYMLTSDLEKADSTLAAALKLKPGSFPALTNRGIVLLRLNRLAEAGTLLEQATKLNGELAVSFYYLGWVQLALKQYESAEAALKTAAGLGGSEAKEAHRSLAKLYIAQYKDKLAADELEIYIQLNPTARDSEQLRMTLLQLRLAPRAAPQNQPL
jgi:Flp pilus assembly protein TadD